MRVITRKKRPRDLNLLAKSIMDDIIQEEPTEEKIDENIYFKELGRRGGLKGGKTRMESLTPEERKELATKAARSRWAKKTPEKTK